MSLFGESIVYQPQQMTEPVRLYNTLSETQEPIEPLYDDTVRMFVCGVTEYDDLHLGHVRTYVVYDVLGRVLERAGYEVFYVQNVTDVGHLTDEREDKILERAGEGSWHHPKAVAEHYEAKHKRLNKRLRIRRPDLMPRASGHIPEIIRDIQELIEAEYAYEADGSVYFRVSKFENYGKLSNADVSDLETGARVEPRPEKEHPADFALWKRADPDHAMQWESPWGTGYPGWHIEDTAIAREYLGDQYDIHGGAIELQFPHHEAEIAQAEAATEISPYVKYWMHSGLVTIDGDKMSKSTGNFVTAEDALAEYSPEALRLWVLSSHYRSPVDYASADLDDAEEKATRLARLRNRLARAADRDAPRTEPTLVDDAEATIAAFDTALCDDLNTPEALAVVYEFVSEVNSALDENAYADADVAAAQDVLETVDQTLAVIPSTHDGPTDPERLVTAIVEARDELRSRGEFELADSLRGSLAEAGVRLEDNDETTTWQWAED